MEPIPVTVPRPRPVRAEMISDAVIHVLGLIAALVATPVLITVAAFTRDGVAVAGTAIYSGTLIAMILASALYHLLPMESWKRVLKRIDHSAIYVKIAGTYTAFVLLSAQGWGVLAGVWAAALAGTSLKVIAPDRFRLAALALYLSMGWGGVALGGALIGTLSWPVIVLMAVGGGLYTVGVVFFLWEKLPFQTAIWHFFVLAASFVFYAAVMVQLLTPMA